MHDALCILSRRADGRDRLVRVSSKGIESTRGLASEWIVSQGTKIFATSGCSSPDELLRPEEPEPLVFIPAAEDFGAGDVLFGLTLSTGGAQLVRALFQGIAFYYRSQLLADGRRSGTDVLSVCGGVFQYSRFCRVLAHVFNMPVITLREEAAQSLIPLLESGEGAQAPFRKALQKFHTLPPHEPDPVLHARYLHHYKRYIFLRRDTILYNRVNVHFETEE